MRVVARLTFGGIGAAGKNAGAFDDDIDAEFAPGELGRVAFFEHFDTFAVDDDCIVVVLNGAVKSAVSAVVLQQRGQSFGVGQIVDREHFEFTRPRRHNAKYQSSDPPKAVNANTNSHVVSPSSTKTKMPTRRLGWWPKNVADGGLN